MSGERLIELTAGALARVCQLYSKRFTRRFAADVIGTFETEAEARLRTGWLALLGFCAGVLVSMMLGAIRDRLPRLSQLLDAGFADARFALRTLWRAPVFAVAAVATLGLGIGASTAVFSVVDGVLLRPLPYGDPGRLVLIGREDIASPGSIGAVPDAQVAQWEEARDRFDGLAGFQVQPGKIALRGSDGRPAEILVTRGTPELFGVLEAEPMLGTLFGLASPDDVLVLGYELWRRQFGSDADVIGRTVSLDDEPRTVIGVLPPGFAFPRESDAYVSRRTALSGIASQWAATRVVARLPADMTLEQATDAVRATSIDTTRGGRVVVRRLEDALFGSVRGVLLAFGGAVGFVLLIAGANVANLLLARSALRRRELAVRGALGAARGRLVQQLLVESVVLGCLGGGLGVLLAVIGVPLLVANYPGDMARLDQVGLDLRVLGFSVALSLCTGFVVGLAPALQLGRRDLTDGLKEGAGASVSALRTLRRAGLRDGLVIAEVALAIVLLVGAGLLLNSFLRLARVDPGLDSKHVVVMSLTAVQGRPAAVVDKALRELVEGARRLPSVIDAAVTNKIPPDADIRPGRYLLEGVAAADAEAWPRAPVVEASDTYFRALGMARIAGRAFTQEEVLARRGVVIVNEAFARRHADLGDVLGRRVLLGGTLREIVGIVGDARLGDLRREPVPAIYRPGMVAVQSLGDGATFLARLYVVVRTEGDPGLAVASLRALSVARATDLEISEIGVLHDRFWGALAQPRFAMSVFVIVSTAALGLALIGVYGLVAHSVSRTTHEIGVRLALGARPNEVVRMVAWRGVTLILVGAAVGLFGASVLARTLDALLFEVTPLDPTTYAGVIGVVLIVGLLASVLPARLAVRVDPVDVLRSQ